MKSVIKSVLNTFLFVVALSVSSGALASAEIKEVCEDIKDKKGAVVKNKDGTNKQSCKKIKVHKKVEGTNVPSK